MSRKFIIVEGKVLAPHIDRSIMRCAAYCFKDGLYEIVFKSPKNMVVHSILRDEIIVVHTNGQDGGQDGGQEDGQKLLEQHEIELDGTTRRIVDKLIEDRPTTTGNFLSRL